uniref:ATP synthase subunit a n=1 Tax=Macrocheles nataliae TaxID=2058476 RepID=A0A6B9WCP0_9ACAR|nr:ATP synthase subunit 6 [Macrocheles nataliae]
MMTNLFSIFDPSTKFYFSLNWMIMIMIMIMIPFNFYFFPPRHYFSVLKLIQNINKEINTNIKKFFKLSIMFLTLFLFIMISNLLGLYPYIFTSTSHLSISLTMALPLWIMIMLFGWISHTNHMFTHLVPLGTPMMLSSFMVIIETISNIIRPITLSVRLTANMIAGHLLLSLLSNISEKMPPLFIPSSIMISTLLFLEYAVSIIQSYVFIILMSLYLSEIN